MQRQDEGERDEMMTQAATCKFFGGDRPIHPSTLYRGIKDGRYPRQVHIGPNTSRWLQSECEEALKRLIAQRDNGRSRQRRQSQGRRPGDAL